MKKFTFKIQITSWAGFWRVLKESQIGRVNRQFTVFHGIDTPLKAHKLDKGHPLSSWVKIGWVSVQDTLYGEGGTMSQWDKDQGRKEVESV